MGDENAQNCWDLNDMNAIFVIGEIDPYVNVNCIYLFHGNHFGVVVYQCSGYTLNKIPVALDIYPDLAGYMYETSCNFIHP